MDFASDTLNFKVKTNAEKGQTLSEASSRRSKRSARRRCRLQQSGEKLAFKAKEPQYCQLDLMTNTNL